MSGPGTIVKSFCQHWHERTASGAARKALETLIPNAPRSTIPVNLDAAAKSVGIEQVVEDDIADADGLLSATESGFYIATLRRTQSRVRKRFTLAHEIRHVVVYRSVGRRSTSTVSNRQM